MLKILDWWTNSVSHMKEKTLPATSKRAQDIMGLGTTMLVVSTELAMKC